MKTMDFLAIEIKITNALLVRKSVISLSCYESIFVALLTVLISITLFYQFVFYYVYITYSDNIMCSGFTVQTLALQS